MVCHGLRPPLVSHCQDIIDPVRIFAQKSNGSVVAAAAIKLHLFGDRHTGLRHVERKARGIETCKEPQPILNQF